MLSPKAGVLGDSGYDFGPQFVPIAESPDIGWYLSLLCRENFMRSSGLTLYIPANLKERTQNDTRFVLG